MKAKLIAVTQPVIEELGDAKDLVAYCARVSNPSNQFNTATADKLVNYLVKHRHWSPLEMVNAVVEVETTRDIARQLLRHSSFRFQEFSQRYADVTQLGDAFTLREFRLQDPLNRQNSVKSDNEALKEEWEKRQNEILDLVKKHYAWALGVGAAKEVARTILPEGLTNSRLYVNGTLRSWCHYLDVRTEEGVTQLEHVELARLISTMIASAFPQVENFTH